MEPVTIGVIRVITADQQSTDRHGRMLEQWYPGVRTISRCLPGQPEGVHDDATMALAEPKVPVLARELEAEGVDGVLISCAGDPGLAQVQAAVSIPVVGAGVSTAAAAIGFEVPVGVLGIMEEAPEAYQRVLGDRLMGSVAPVGVSTTLDLQTPEGRAAAIAAARGLRETGAGVIALACTGFCTIGLAPELERAIGIPVLDPVLCAGAAMLREIARCRWVREK